MHAVQFQLDDKHYEKALQRASAAGFESIEEYVADVVASELEEAPEDLGHLFTPARLALIQAALDEVRAGGRTYTIEETTLYLAEQRAEWLKNQPK